MKTSTAAPVAAAYLWLDVGSVDEGADQAGAAHFLEHLVFKGTARRGVGEAAAEIEGLGGDLNAYTTYDHTVLHATTSADCWREAVDVIADMARHSRFDAREMERERTVVIDEIRGYDDDAESVVHDALQARLFPDHPYGRPILGTAPSVRGLDRELILDFWRRGYAPNRAVLAVAGPVEEAEVLACARALLGSWSPTPARQPIANPPTPPSHDPYRVRRHFDASTAQLAWRTPQLGHPDLPALEVLCAALGQGAAAILPVKLQLEAGVTTAVWSDLSSRMGGGALSIGLYPLEGKTEAAITLALEAVDDATRRGLSGSLVERARNAMLADQLFAQETVDGLAHDLAWYTARAGGPEAQRLHRQALRAVTPSDVNRVARKWLQPTSAHVVAVDRGLSTRALRTACRPAPRPTPQPRKGVIEGSINGARVFVLPDDTAVASIRIVGLGGALAISPRHAGLAAAWSQMVVAGAGKWDATAFAEAQDRVAAMVHGLSGRNTTGLSASFPSSNLQEGVELVGQALLEPHFAPQEWERVQAELLEDIRTLEDRPGEVGGRAMWAALFPKHPWRLPHGGTLASVARIRPATLARWHRQLFAPDNLAVAVAGGVEPDAVFETLRPWLEALGPGPGLAERDAPGSPRRVVRPVRAGNEQTSVTLCARGPDLYSPDRPALELAAAILGGQGGRLFMDLREGHGLGYSVWAQWVTGLDGGIFLAGLATDPDRRQEATDALRQTLERFVRDGPTDDEIGRCRRMLVGQMAMSMQRVTGRASDLAIAKRYGLPWGLEAWRAQLASVTRAQIMEALERMGLLEPLEIAVLPR